MSSSLPALAAPSRQRILSAGLLAGLLVNAIDVPNSAIVVAPRWTAFLTEHGITLDTPLVSGFYLGLHLLYGVALAAAYLVARVRFGPGPRTALISTLFVLGIHRAFGLGMVVMGTMPLGIYAMFSASMTAGTLLGGLAAARVVDRGSGAKQR